ncbi:uncharacterized protein TNCV_295091 [Trichonephila clavipes]|nr:uncharacterized protein TNCV_295091 [Trichonephila clavipes]
MTFKYNFKLKAAEISEDKILNENPFWVPKALRKAGGARFRLDMPIRSPIYTELDSDKHVIQKRPTVLLNRLVYALQNVIQPDETFNRQHQDLERRGYPKHYWKCYFNAVSCFRRKRQVS